MRRHSSVVFGYGSLWLFVCLQVTATVTINCTRGEPIEDRPYELYCTDINPAQRVEWRRSFEGSSGDGIIASCADVNICTSNDVSRYNVSRRVGTTSSLFIFNVRRDDDTTWTCLSGGETSSCTLPPSIYPPLLSAPCNAELTITGPVARCPIEKVYPPPECSWFESVTMSNGTEINTTIPMSSAESMLESVSASYEGKVYFSATCKLQRNVTYLEGTYSYWAIISPGSVRHTVQFEGPSTVVAPSVPTLEGCSSGYTPATQDVICTCKVNNLGWPRGHVTWLDQRGGVVRTGQNNSVQLLSRDIPECSENTNITYTCEVRSTDNFRRTIDYTPTLAFGPQYVKVTGPTAFLVDGKQPMTLTCTAVKVNPRPVFTWQGQPDDAQTSAVSQAEDPLSYRESISFVPTMGHDGRIISCFAKNSGFNGTSVPSATFTISLIRPGADNPESAELSSSDTTVFFAAVGVTSSLCVIFLIIIVCLCCRARRKHVQYQNDKARTMTGMENFGAEDTDVKKLSDHDQETGFGQPQDTEPLDVQPRESETQTARGEQSPNTSYNRPSVRQSEHYYSTLDDVHASKPGKKHQQSHRGPGQSDAGEYVDMDPKGAAKQSSVYLEPKSPTNKETSPTQTSSRPAQKDSPPHTPAPSPPGTAGKENMTSAPKPHTPTGAGYLTAVSTTHDRKDSPVDQVEEQPPSSQTTTPELPPLPDIPQSSPQTPS